MFVEEFEMCNINERYSHFFHCFILAQATHLALEVYLAQTTHLAEAT